MKKDEKIALTIGGLIIAFFVIKYFIVKKETKKIINNLFSSGDESKPTSVITSRNAINNAGNIRKSSTVYQGEITSPSDGFKSFSSLIYGYRAMIQILRNYYNQKGLHTLTQIINTYAPASDNNVPSMYAAAVASMAGVSQDKDLGDILFSENIVKIIAAMSEFEQGAGFLQNINTDSIKNAYTLVGDGRS